MEVDTGQAESVEGEPESKRPRLSTMRVGEDMLSHVDTTGDEYFQQLEELVMEYPHELVDDENEMFYEHDDENVREMCEDDLWQPFSTLEPVLDSDTMLKIDQYADDVEIDRLKQMGVLAMHGEYTGELGTQLSAKFVRAWRKKTRKTTDATGKTVETPGWLRRSRLVAREYNWMDVRDDVYSPSSSSSIVKLLPALAITDGFIDNCVLGTLDIGDAFLQVGQPVPRIVRLGNRDFVILKCLPGQRDASKLWYLHFVDVLKQKFDAKVCTEQPCVIKVDGKAAMVLHVDDVLFMGDESWLRNVFLPELEKQFKVSSTSVSREQGGSFEFLKRCHVIDPHYSQITVYPEAKHVCAMYDRYAKANGKPPRLAKTPCASTNAPLSAELDEPLTGSLAEEFRSLVGIAMYVSQERFDIQFATKTLASSLKDPTRRSWIDLGRLVGYMKFSESFALRMKRMDKGTTFQEQMHDGETKCKMNCVETFSDSDWSGRSTSAAIHVLNGIVVWSTSRSQKCVSLSSTEAEWYAATSGACDGLYLHHIVSFLCDGNVKPLVLHTDNSAVRMLSKKLGAGRLRHIRGRLLWLQEKVGNDELVIKQVGTNYNIADVNTKALSKDRFLCLLHLIGFVCNDESVGELEFSRMEAKEMLKHQVRLVKQMNPNNSDRLPSAQSSKMAKQVLRALAVWNIMEMADGSMFPFSVREVGSIEALGHWRAALSPMTLVFLLGFILMLTAVIFMMPGGNGDEPEPEGESQDEDSPQEPSAEPPTVRHTMYPNSLGLKFPNVFMNVMFRAEGVLLWLAHRCEHRIFRGKDASLNSERYEVLIMMIRRCMNGMTAFELENLKDDLMSMADLTDDENSPRYNATQDVVQNDVNQAFQAYQVGMSFRGRIMQDREQAEAAHMSNDEAADDMEESEESSGMDEQQTRAERYSRIPLSEASDPDLWVAINYGYRRGPDGHFESESDSED